jgi:hypothetical protein
MNEERIFGLGSKCYFTIKKDSYFKHTYTSHSKAYGVCVLPPRPIASFDINDLNGKERTLTTSRVQRQLPNVHEV